MLKFDTTGALLDTFDPATGPRGTDWIDLASNQVTLFYTSEGDSIKRYDLGADAQLSDFATIPPGDGAAYALRIRPNGEVMVAKTDKVYRLDAAGNIMQFYDTDDLPIPESSFFFALNLDPDGTSFWTAGFSTGNIYRINIETGAVITQFNAGPVSPSLAGLAVFGEITAVNPPPIDQVIPEVPFGTVIAGVAMAIGFAAYVGIKPQRLFRKRP